MIFGERGLRGMPLPQYEYDDYEYGRIKRTASTASRTSTSRNISSSKRENNKQSVRNALMGDVGAEKRRATTKKTTSNSSNLKKKSATVSRARNSRGNAELDVPVKKRSTSVQSKKSQNIRKAASLEKPQEMSLKNAEVVRNTKSIAKKKANVLRNVMVSLSVFSILFLICYRSSLINESFKDLKNVKRNLEQTENMNAQIESEIQTQTDLANIESYAKYQLGMQKPKDSQIRKVVVPKKDKISTPVVIEEEKENFWGSLLNDIMNILD